MQRKLVLSDQSLKKLIKEVKKRECLWNPHDVRYNDRYRMAKAWMEIADLLELPEDRLRVKWKNLRDLFKKEIKKYGSANYSGKWRHYNAMKFLNKVTNNSKPDEQTENPTSIENIANKDNEEKSEASKVATKEELTDDDCDFVDDQDVTAVSPEAEVYYDRYEEDPLPDKPQNLPDEDYDMMFLKSLGPYFRQLDPIRKLVVRSKMQDMLLNEIAAQASANQFHSKKS